MLFFPLLPFVVYDVIVDYCHADLLSQRVCNRKARGFHRLSKAETMNVHNAVAVGESNLHYREHFPDFQSSARARAEQAAVGAPE